MYKYIFFTLLIVLLAFSCKQEEKVVPPPEIYLQMPEGGFDFDIDSVELIEPKITYDIDSEYSWVENGIEILDEKILTFENRALGEYNFSFSVRTPMGEDMMDIKAHSLDINTFEEFINFNENGYNNQGENGFHQFKYVQYPCNYDAALPNDWNGFAISKNASTSDSSTKGEFSVYGSSAADESDNFTIFKQSNSPNNIIFSDSQAHKVKSIALNNCTRSYLYMEAGFQKKEGKDYLLLTIKGLDEEGTSIATPIEVLLADYRPEETAQKYIIADWITVDLTSLGVVHQISFELSSSRDDDEDFELPMYFCLDNFKIIE